MLSFSLAAGDLKSGYEIVGLHMFVEVQGGQIAMQTSSGDWPAHIIKAYTDGSDHSCRVAYGLAQPRMMTLGDGSQILLDLAIFLPYMESYSVSLHDTQYGGEFSFLCQINRAKARGKVGTNPEYLDMAVQAFKEYDIYQTQHHNNFGQWRNAQCLNPMATPVKVQVPGTDGHKIECKLKGNHVGGSAGQNDRLYRAAVEARSLQKQLITEHLLSSFMPNVFSSAP